MILGVEDIDKFDSRRCSHCHRKISPYDTRRGERIRFKGGTNTRMEATPVDCTGNRTCETRKQMFYMTEKHVPLDPHEPSREGTSTQTRNCRRFLYQVPSGHSYGLGPDFGTTDRNDREQVVEPRLVVEAVEEIQEVSYCFSRHMTCFSDR